MRHKILIVEDDASFGLMLQKWFERNDFKAILVTKVEQAKKEIFKDNFSLILTDLRLPDGDGIMLLAWIKEQKISTPVIVMTSYGEIQSAVSSIKLGAFDYLEKPINPSILSKKIEQALNHIPGPPVDTVATNKTEQHSDIVYGTSKAAKEMHEYLKIVAPTKMSVLITGESGTGKEYAARIIHENSQRKNAPFIAVDCGSLSKELAPSELFGHIKGSFTSAISDKKGVFEIANGGTVFLDEIGNLSYDVQVQLLRTLQEFKIRPVGSATDIKVDVRIIVATNENLETAISEGKFREDLYHRLNEFFITIPPLRQRIDDLPVFAQYFLNLANQELEKDIKRFSEDAMEALMKHNWTGNLRELRNVVRRATLFSQTDEILLEHLPSFSPHSVLTEDLSLKSVNEKERIEIALKKANGNKTKAAGFLKIDRKTLYNKMHQYGIDI
ncbi:MAG: sigma-54 dependent transcriptional regulator [Bacteroidales bacterium]|jgi:two-component system response regulator HydG|nr:sigma-54 dependent transcriptional regulator [Bacteroidales bacterium]